MAGPPLIGLTTSEIRDGSLTPHGEPAQREMALGLTYARAISQAGGIPVVLPPLADEQVAPLLRCLNGICLSGGPDIDPAGYGEEPDAQLGPTHPELDHFELAVAREADRLDMPLLGICRGAQAINVARGGSLHQHLPALTAIEEHRQSAPGTEAVHEVELTPDSRLAKLLGTEKVAVNSFHHQAVRKLGRGVKAVGFSGDGVIEAIEVPKRSFLIGVQWHIETLTGRPEHLGLLEAFVDQAARFEAGAAARQVA